MTGPRIVFAGDFHWQAGSSHTIAEYVRTAAEVGCEVAVSRELSRLDGHVDAVLPLVDDLAWGSHLVLVFEGRQFLDAQRLDLVERRIPRRCRLIVDPDGRWGPYLACGTDDEGGPERHAAWQDLYRRLSATVLQPRLGQLPDGAWFFSYFGMPQPVAARRPARWDLQYVGANWWRWRQFADLVEAARTALGSGRVRVCGRWWDGAPHPEHLAATGNEPGWLAARGVDVRPPVPFGQVVTTMAESVLTPVLARPLLARKRLLTPRMLETLAAVGTAPVLPASLAYTRHLYGDAIVPFLLGDAAADALARLHREAEARQSALDALRAGLYHRFNYRTVLSQLLTFFD
ncbi:glycosyltransferase family protein [Sphaerimonospora thailandensis]|uniref:Spore protein YkvP/CgeB glycosyl transferase-like domain-containing protein n=1 Tax=Sphaerimonospora thailandensis TaxID=795644 RepID=A0A8J3R3X7_9ACTN|nr:hypothetical protein [Sphaerimonospora thailandensis]GIH68786.1 hypothetical protein Mth01_10390 [Sphaerimonospora thailandensis]